jgi:heme A synthase
LEVPVILIGVIVSHLQSAVACGHWVRRNGTSRIPYEKIASPERDEPLSLRKGYFAGTNVSLFDVILVNKEEVSFQNPQSCY